MEYYLPYIFAIAANASNETSQVAETAHHVPTTGEYIVFGVIALLVVSFVAWFTRPREY